MRDQKHSFAIYYAELDVNFIGQTKLVVTNLEIVHRVGKVLRLEIGDEVILFSNNFFVTGLIGLIDKKILILDQTVWTKSAHLLPKIVVSIGLLKKENFENALYSCVELGANCISPVIFAKSTPQKLNQERIEKILISAAEQSKNFNLPEYQEQVLFINFLTKIKNDLKTIYIYCDISGQEMFDVVTQLKKQACNKIVLIIGPEGDLTFLEKQQLLAQPNVIFMRLTPTILRSFQAVTVALGALRSLLN